MMRRLLILTILVGCACAQYTKSVKGGYGGHGFQYQAGDNLIKIFGNTTQHGYDMRQNVTSSHIDYEKGVCYIEVPTASLVRDPTHVPAGNGSRPDLSRIRSCCRGYSKNIHNYHICDPVCNVECVNALCTAPDTCTCFPDHVKNLAGFCIPTCPIGCQNGQCAGGECICQNGYKLDIDGKYCVPVCKENCGGKGNCTAADTCSCTKGYSSTPEGSCKPACEKCINGDCVAPNECHCHHGYALNQQGQCTPQCAQTCGSDGRCISPNVCDYPPNSVRVPTNQLPGLTSNQSSIPHQGSNYPYPNSQGTNQQVYPSIHHDNPNNPSNQNYYPYSPNHSPSYPYPSNQHNQGYNPSNQNSTNPYPSVQHNQPNYPTYQGTNYPYNTNQNPTNSYSPSQGANQPTNVPNQGSNYPYPYNQDSNQYHNYGTNYYPSSQGPNNLNLPTNQNPHQPNLNQPHSQNPNQPNLNYHPSQNPNQPSYFPNQPNYPSPNHNTSQPSNYPSYPNEDSNYPYYSVQSPSNQYPEQSSNLQIPICSQPCINGVCVEGNRCSCNPGYVLDTTDPTGTRCRPNCPGGCPNGVCSAPNFCICNMGYFKDHSVKGRPSCVKRIRRSIKSNYVDLYY